MIGEGFQCRPKIHLTRGTKKASHICLMPSSSNSSGHVPLSARIGVKDGPWSNTAACSS